MGVGRLGCGAARQTHVRVLAARLSSRNVRVRRAEPTIGRATAENRSGFVGAVSGKVPPLCTGTASVAVPRTGPNRSQPRDRTRQFRPYRSRPGAPQFAPEIWWKGVCQCFVGYLSRSACRGPFWPGAPPRRTPTTHSPPTRETSLRPKFTAANPKAGHPTGT